MVVAAEPALLQGHTMSGWVARQDPELLDSVVAFTISSVCAHHLLQLKARIPCRCAELCVGSLSV